MKRQDACFFEADPEDVIFLRNLVGLPFCIRQKVNRLIEKQSPSNLYASKLSFDKDFGEISVLFT
jgi:hypothetical protein